MEVHNVKQEKSANPNSYVTKQFSLVPGFLMCWEPNIRNWFSWLYEGCWRCIGIRQEAINLLSQRLDSGRVSRARSGPVNVFPYCLLPSNSLTQIVRTIDRCLAAARSGVWGIGSRPLLTRLLALIHYRFAPVFYVCVLGKQSTAQCLVSRAEARPL